MILRPFPGADTVCASVLFGGGARGVAATAFATGAHAALEQRDHDPDARTGSLARWPARAPGRATAGAEPPAHPPVERRIRWLSA